MTIGNKVKSLRLQHGLTQEELANRCELSKGFISMLENDLTSPSISTMEDLLEVFSISLYEFFKQTEEDEITYLKEERFVKKNEDTVIEYLISDAQAKKMEPIKITLLPVAKTDNLSPHDGEVFGYVLKGKIQLLIGDKTYQLNKGDSFYYSKPMEEQWIENLSSKSEAEFIMVSTPPLF